MSTAPRVLRVLLRAEFDASAYEQRWRAGSTPDRLPYGLEHEPDGWRIEVARGRAASKAETLLGRAIRRVTGFDLLHAWRNRRFLDSAETVYCHSEVEYLGAAAVLSLLRNRSTLLLGQTIWLFHAYSSMPRWRQVLLARLLHRIDVFVYNAAPNLEIGRALLPRSRHEYVPFGVSSVFTAIPDVPTQWDVLSVGNDVGRDWAALAAALEPLGLRVRVATDQRVLQDTDAVVGPTSTLQELRELYAASRCVVIAVRPNAHASGITSLLEAAANGNAVVATRTGGLDSYFGDDAVRFVPPSSAPALRAAILDVLGDDALAARLGTALQARFTEQDYSNARYWRRIADLIAAVRPLAKGPRR